MAKDIKLIVGGDIRRAEEALRELERTGSNVANRLEREFDQLGTKSDDVFRAKRDAAQRSYEKIKASGIATASELKRAEKGLASELASLDEQQYGERLTLAQKFRDNLGGIAAASGIAYGAFRIGQDAIDQAANFQTALTDLGKLGVKDLGAVRKEIMALPEEFGTATELVQGYYQTISAGVIDPKKALELLTQAAQTAKTAHTDQAVVIKGLTKVMAGFGGEIKTAAEASDLLFGIERLGQTTVAELVPVIGNLASISHQAGISQYEMAAALSNITQTAGTTEQAATQLRAIMVSLLNPNKDMTAALEELGYTSGRAAVDARGFAGALKSIAQTSAVAENGLAGTLGSVEALAGAAPLISDGFANFNSALIEMQNNAGATNRAFAEWRGTFEATKTLFENTIGKVMIELGTELAPTVQNAMKDIANWIRENKGELISFAQTLGALFEGIVSAGSAAIKTFVAIGKAIGDAAGAASISVENFGSTIKSGYSSVIPNINAPWGTYFPTMDTGTKFVPKTGLYMLHRGETVKTRDETATSSSGNVTISAPINITMHGSSNNPEQTARELARLVEPKLRALAARYRK